MTTQGLNSLSWSHWSDEIPHHLRDMESQAKQDNKGLLNFLGVRIFAWHPFGPTKSQAKTFHSSGFPRQGISGEDDDTPQFQKDDPSFSVPTALWIPDEVPLESDHPSSFPLQDNMGIKDLVHLLHECQRHTRCTPDTCLKRYGSEIRWKAHFPKLLTSEAEFRVPQGKSDQHLTFEPARNDPFLNQYNLLLLACVRSNHDVKAIVTKHLLLNYLTKYVTKQEPRSNAFSSVHSSLPKDSNQLSSSQNRLVFEN